MKELSVIIGVVGIVLAVCSVMMLRKCKPYDRKVAWFLLVISLTFVALSVAAILCSYPAWSAGGMILAIGILVFGFGVIDLIKSKRCTVELTGICVEERPINSRGHVPVFRYRYEAVDYTEQGGTAVTPRRFQKLYEIGGEVQIMIDPLAPTHCYDKRLRSSGKAFMFIVGAAFIAVGVFFIVGSFMGFVTAK